VEVPVFVADGWGPPLWRRFEGAVAARGDLGLLAGKDGEILPSLYSYSAALSYVEGVSTLG